MCECPYVSEYILLSRQRIICTFSETINDMFFLFIDTKFPHKWKKPFAFFFRGKIIK